MNKIVGIIIIFYCKKLVSVFVVMINTSLTTNSNSYYYF